MAIFDCVEQSQRNVRRWGESAVVRAECEVERMWRVGQGGKE